MWLNYKFQILNKSQITNAPGGAWASEGAPPNGIGFTMVATNTLSGFNLTPKYLLLTRCHVKLGPDKIGLQLILPVF